MPHGPGNNTLMVFFKEPVEGLVKTRLAKDIGEAGALKVAQVLLEYTLDVVYEIEDVSVALFYDGKGKSRLPLGSVKKDYQLRGQVKGNLGERFLAAFRQMFEEGASKVVVIGTDCIGLTPKILQDALSGLQDHDITIGPTEDGGYYILGLKDLTVAKQVLMGIPWSTDKVFHETMEKAKGFSVRVLPKLYDVDTMKDWERAKHDDRNIAAILKELDRKGGP
jgi:rSAM/selenodomain-associated transferase 1